MPATKVEKDVRMDELTRVSYKVLGHLTARSSSLGALKMDLRRSRHGVRPEAYMAYCITVSAITAFVFVALALLGWFVVLPVAGLALPPPVLVLFLAVPVGFGVVTYFVLMVTPKSKAKQRAKDIELRIPYALNYIAAMASAGVNIDEVFRSLGEQKIYGECAREAAAVYRDMAYFGKDSVTAMRRSIDRAPSDKWAEFMQGAITTVTSGGDLQLYFSSKAQRYMWENRQMQKQFVEVMGLMAETYVTAAVAGPLFLIVMMAIMGMLGGEGPQQLYMVIYLLLPVANGGFVFALKNMTPDV